MEVHVKSGTDARKLALDGYERSGKKTIRATIEELESLLDRDDVSVTQVKLHRQAGGNEADVIDEYIKAGVASDYGGSVSIVKFKSHVGRNSIRIRPETTDVLTATEDSLTVKRMFREAILDAPLTKNIYDHESFDAAREKVFNAIESKIEDHEQSIDSLHSRRQEIASQSPVDVGE